MALRRAPCSASSRCTVCLPSCRLGSPVEFQKKQKPSKINGKLEEVFVFQNPKLNKSEKSDFARNFWIALDRKTENSCCTPQVLFFSATDPRGPEQARRRVESLRERLRVRGRSDPTRWRRGWRRTLFGRGGRGPPTTLTRSRTTTTSRPSRALLGTGSTGVVFRKTSKTSSAPRRRRRRRRRRPSTTPEAGAGASRRSSRSRWSWSRPNPGFQTTHRARGELSLFLFPFSCASAFLDRANDRPWILTPQPTLSSAIQLSVLRAQAPGFPEGPRRAGAPGPAPGLAALAPVGLRLLVRDAAQGGSDDPDRPGAPTSGRPCEEEAQPAAEDQAGGVSAAQR